MKRAGGKNCDFFRERREKHHREKWHSPRAVPYVNDSQQNNLVSVVTGLNCGRAGEIRLQDLHFICLQFLSFAISKDAFH